MFTNNLSDESLLNLLTLVSPSFPVGGYAYSHGIEYAVERKNIQNEQDLCLWIEAILSQGAGRIDGLLFRITWQAVTDENFNKLKWVAERGDIMRSTNETALESSSQGEAFLETVRGVWESEKIEVVMSIIEEIERKPTYAIAVAIVLAVSGVPLRAALLAYFHSFSSNLVSAGIRLIPLGQAAGQRCIQLIKPIIKTSIEAALCDDFEDIGTAAPIIELASMKHETQYTRLFRS